MKHDAIYARFSSDAQADGNSIEIQTEACQKLLGGQPKLYIDTAKTGRARAGRFGLDKLLADAKAGKIKRLCVWRFSRIGRNLAESATTIQELEDHDVQITSVHEGSDTFARSIFLAMAEHYSKELAVNTRAGLVKRHEGGFHTGGPPPYGYKIVPIPGDKVKKRIAIDEHEVEVVRSIFKDYLRESIGFKEIARRLDARGIKTRHGGIWRFTTVRGIVTNRLLLGEIIYLRRTFKLNRETGRRVPKANQKESHKIKIDDSLRIIDDETFYRAQEKQATNRRDYQPRGPKQLRPFTRLLFCDECGSVCYARRSKNDKGEYYYYSCGCRQSGGPAACPNAKSVREDLLQVRIMRALGDMFLDAEDMIAEASALAVQRVEVYKSDASRLRSEIAGVEAEIGKYLPLLVDPDIGVGAKRVISGKLSELEGRQASLRVSLDAVGVQAASGTSELAEAIRDAFREAKECFAESASAEAFNRLVSEAVGPMVIEASGRVAQRKAPSGSREGRWGPVIAGACADPVCAIVGASFRRQVARPR